MSQHEDHDEPVQIEVHSPFSLGNLPSLSHLYASWTPGFPPLLRDLAARLHSGASTPTLEPGLESSLAESSSTVTSSAVDMPEELAGDAGDGPVMFSEFGLDPARPRRSLSSNVVDEEEQAELRRRIQQIQKGTGSERDKAKFMQALMSSRYRQFNYARTVSAEKKLENVAGSQLTLEDITKTYYNEELGVLGCRHYRRNCKLRCSQCSEWVSCRFCHDEKSAGQANGGHSLIRQETKEMLCMICLKTQPAAQTCKFCHTRMARYFCDRCKLWDDMPNKDIYHCNDCGICRIGLGLGKDYFHCKTCNVCMAISLEDSHKCIERSTECNCPICGEWMFASTQTVIFMPCGHSIHQGCYHEYIAFNYRCPTCYKTLGNMDHTFRLLDMEILRQRMPPPYDSWVATITCNDCHARSEVPHHFLGHKCTSCRSYNTAVKSIQKPEEEEEEEAVSESRHVTPNRSTGINTPSVGAIEEAMVDGYIHSNLNRLDTALAQHEQEGHVDDAGVRALIGHYGLRALTHGAGPDPDNLNQTDDENDDGDDDSIQQFGGDGWFS